MVRLKAALRILTCPYEELLAGEMLSLVVVSACVAHGSTRSEQTHRCGVITLLVVELGSCSP